MPRVEMPQLGESVTEGTILRWYKQPGDAVALDEPLCEIETEKVTDELPSPYEGTMGEILVAEGETAPVHAPLCEIVAAGASADPERLAVTSAGRGDRRESTWSGGPMAIRDEPSAPSASRPKPPAANGQRKPEDRSKFFSPVVMRLAAEHGLDLSGIKGTGAGGRVTRKDVEAALGPTAAQEGREGEAPQPEAAPRPEAPAAAPAPAAASEAPYEVVPLSATRRAIAGHLARSNVEAPQAWTMVEVDLTGLVQLRAAQRAEYRERHGVDLTLLPYFVVAVIETLGEHPALNARWENDELRRYPAPNVGIAVAAESGLVVPVIHNAADLSLAGIARAIGDLAERARARTLRREDVEGGTITVNNTGSFGSIASKPIVNTPEVAIVTLERVVKRPVVVEGDAIAIRSMANICLSFDHRALDGLEAGAFLAGLKERLEARGPAVAD